MIKKKLRATIALFFAGVALSAAGGILYLQSEQFANFVKKVISERSDQNLGVVGDFKNLKLYFFPPGIGIAEATMTVQRENIAKAPIEAKIEAKEIRISFTPIQMFSGTLQVEEFKVVGGSIIGSVDAEALKPAKKTPVNASNLKWNDLFQLQINGIHLEDTFLHLDLKNNQSTTKPMAVQLVVKDLDLRKSLVNKKQGFSSQGTVSAVKLDIPKSILNLPVQEAYQIQWNATWNDEGVNFSPFAVDIEGLNLKLYGKIKGNVLDGKSNLRLEAETQITSNLLAFCSNHFEREDLSGDVDGSAKVTGDLRDLEKTLSASYQVTAKEVAWNELKFSFLHSEGVVSLPLKQIEIKTLNVLSPESSSKTTEIGEVMVKDTVIPIQLDKAFDASIKIKKGDLHWLGGAVIDDIFMLQGIVSGDIKARFTPANGKASNWKLGASVELAVDQFALTNQKWKIKKPMKYILRPPLPVKIVGQVDINQLGADFTNTTVQIQKTKFDVTGGVHPSKEGLSIVGKGPVDLKEINEIAEVKIEGVGDIKIDVHGPLKTFLIDFDADIKGIKYIDLAFGDLNGRVTYDNDITELRFKNIAAQLRKTVYSLATGSIDLIDDHIRLPIVIQSGRVEDLSFALASIIKKIDWFPTSLIGEVHGQIELGGKIDLNDLEIKTSLEGTDWDWLDEKARKIKMNFGYDRGKYYAHNVNLTKTNGQVLGNIDFNSNDDQIQWDFHTENFALTDIDFVDRLEAPARSKIQIRSAGHGKMNQVQSSSEARMFETVIKGERLEPTVVSVELGEKTLRMKMNVFGNRLQSQIKYAFTPKQPSQFLLDLNNFDFSPILVILNPKLLDDVKLEALVDGHVQLDFLSTQSELARGSVIINKYLLQKNDFFFKLANPIELPVQLGFFNLKPAKFIFKNSEIVISGEGNRGNVEVLMEGAIDLALAEFFSSSIEKIRGSAPTKIRIHGPMKDLKVVGDLSFEGVYALMRWMQSPFEEIDGSVRIRQGVIYVEGVESYLADELFYLNGTIKTYTDRIPKLDLKAQFEDNKVKLAPLDLVQVRGSIWMHGEVLPYFISGNVEVLQGLWTKSFADRGGVSVRGERFKPALNLNQTSNSLFQLDLNVNANHSVFVKNEIMDAEFRGKVKMMGPPDDPKMIGEAHLVQGKILFRDRPFLLESVKVVLDDPLQFNPKFNASAISEVAQYKIRLLASGQGSQVKAEFNSTPYLPENEIYSLLTSGLTSSDTGRFRSKDRSYVNQGEAASLILHSLDFSQDVQRKTGLQFDVEEAIDKQSASSVFRPQTLSENVASPKLVLKRNVGRNINLSVASTVGVGTETIREANAEYKLTPGLSFIGVWNAIDGVNTQQTRTSYGLDFRLNKKFK